MAFSAGPRRCLGYTFAIAVIKATLSELWRNARVSMPDRGGIGGRLAITQGQNRLPLSLHRPHGRFAAAKFTDAAVLQMSRATTLARDATGSSSP